MVASEEHIVQRSDAGDQQHQQEAERQNVGAVGAEVFRGHCRDDLVGGYDTLGSGDAEHELAERLKRVDHNAGTGAQNQEAERCFERATDHLAGALAQGDQTDRHDNADEIGRYVENLLSYEVEDINEPIHGCIPFR